MEAPALLVGLLGEEDPHRVDGAGRYGGAATGDCSMNEATEYHEPSGAVRWSTT